MPGGFAYGFVGAYGCRTEVLSGLVYMRARWYSPQLGRFVSRDPIGLSAGPNLYTYTSNNPVRYVDPSGLEFIVRGDPRCECDWDAILEYIQFLANITGLYIIATLFKEECKAILDYSKTRSKPPRDKDLRDRIKRIIDSDKTHIVNISRNSGLLLGEATDGREQSLDIGDFDELGKLDPKLRDTIFAHEHYELENTGGLDRRNMSSKAANEVFLDIHQKAIQNVDNQRGYPRRAGGSMSMDDQGIGSAVMRFKGFDLMQVQTRNPDGSVKLTLSKNRI